MKVNVKGQGQIAVNRGDKLNPYGSSNINRINSKLYRNIVYGLALSWLVFGGDRPWPSWLALQVENYWPQGQIFRF